MAPAQALDPRCGGRRPRRTWPARVLNALRVATALLAMLLGMLAAPAAQAHLMPAQRGTLNIVGSGAFMVLSLPVSALTGVDDDKDGRMSRAELHAHVGAIEAQIVRGVQLHDAIGTRPLQGLMLTLSPSDDTPSAPAERLIVMGRFALDSDTTGLRLSLSLFGHTAAERTQDITVSRGTQKQRMVLTPERSQRDMLPSAWVVFIDHATLGAEHVLGGMDHLLFLLVVLATGWRLRQIVLALSCFTAGHAITLAASVWGGWVVPSAIVEPAIAATIVGMALFDRWSRNRPQALPPSVRLGLVFACALIHGLGLAGALTDMGLDTASRLWSLAGFNLGIEAGQLAVALAAAATIATVRRLGGGSGLAVTTRLASWTAMAAGSLWFVQRVIG